MEILGRKSSTTHFRCDTRPFRRTPCSDRPRPLVQCSHRHKNTPQTSHSITTSPAPSLETQYRLMYPAKTSSAMTHACSTSPIGEQFHHSCSWLTSRNTSTAQLQNNCSHQSDWNAHPHTNNHVSTGEHKNPWLEIVHRNYPMIGRLHHQYIHSSINH